MPLNAIPVTSVMKLKDEVGKDIYALLDGMKNVSVLQLHLKRQRPGMMLRRVVRRDQPHRMVCE